MATTEFQWVIKDLKCAVESDGLSDVINTIHWRYNATQTIGGKVFFADTYGSASLSQPNPQNFIPYSNVTEAEVVKWLEEILPVKEMQENLNDKIDLKVNPVETSLPLPWS